MPAWKLECLYRFLSGFTVAYVPPQVRVVRYVLDEYRSTQVLLALLHGEG